MTLARVFFFTHSRVCVLACSSRPVLDRLDRFDRLDPECACRHARLDLPEFACRARSFRPGWRQVKTGLESVNLDRLDLGRNGLDRVEKALGIF